MANEQDNTTLAGLIPEKWRPRYLEALYDPYDIIPHVLNCTEDFGGVGDIAHVSVEGTGLTVNNVASDGSLTVQTQTPTDVSITINNRSFSGAIH